MYVVYIKVFTMMSNIRKTIVLLPLKIQYILIFVENIYRLCRFNWKLLFDNLKKDRIVIHSMGKVGSSTIDASLKPYKFNMPIFKTHYLNPLTVSKLWNEKFSIYRRRIRDHYLENKYLTQNEVADRFRVTPSTIKNWRDEGKLEYFQVPGSTRVLYPRESIEDFERQNTKKEKVLEFRRPAEVNRKTPGMSSKPKKEWRI